MRIGDRIKQEREKQGLSQPGLAALCGWSGAGRISNYERNTREPTAEDLKKIANALNVKPESITFGVDSNPKNMQEVYRTIPKDRVPLIVWEQLTDWANHEGDPVDINPIPSFIQNPRPEIDSGGLFALKVRDDSMISTQESFNIGSVIIFQVLSQFGSPYSGCFVVGCHHGTDDPIFRQFIMQGKRSFLKPLNAQYPTEELADFNILGVLIHSQKDFMQP